MLEVLLDDDANVESVTAAAAAIDWEEVEVDRDEKDMEGDALEDAAKDVDAGGADDFWEKASEQPMKPDADDDSLTYEEAQELGLLEDD